MQTESDIKLDKIAEIESRRSVKQFAKQIAGKRSRKKGARAPYERTWRMESGGGIDDHAQKQERLAERRRRRWLEDQREPTKTCGRHGGPRSVAAALERYRGRRGGRRLANTVLVRACTHLGCATKRTSPS